MQESKMIHQIPRNSWELFLFCISIQDAVISKCVFPGENVYKNVNAEGLERYLKG